MAKCQGWISSCFAGRARASPVNQDGWLNLQRSRNKHKTNGGDRFCLEYNQSSTPACSSALLKLRSLLEYHFSLPEWVVYRVFAMKRLLLPLALCWFRQARLLPGNLAMTGGMTNANMLLMGLTELPMSVEVFMGGERYFRYLLERRGWGCRPLQCNWKLAYWIPRFITRRCLWQFVEYCNW